MKKIQKKKNNYKSIGVIAAAVVIVGLVSVVVAYNGNSPKVVVEGDYIEAPQPSQELGEVSFGGTAAVSTSHITSNVQVLADLDLTATTTIQEINYGSRYFQALDFSAGNTSTPGALASICNTGITNVCSVAVLDISVGSTTVGHDGSGAAWAFSLSTSTSAVDNGGIDPTLIATTTLATSSAIILDNTKHVGAYNASSFTWGNGVCINAQFDTPDTDAAATSTAYTSMAGGLYVTCHTR